MPNRDGSGPRGNGPGTGRGRGGCRGRNRAGKTGQAGRGGGAGKALGAAAAPFVAAAASDLRNPDGIIRTAAGAVKDFVTGAGGKKPEQLDASREITPEMIEGRATEEENNG